MKETLSQIFKLGPTFYFITKNGKLYAIFFSIIFSTMHKIKSKPYIKNLRHRSLPYDSEKGY